MDLDLKAGQKVEIDGLPYLMDYTVEEDAVEGYAADVPLNAKGSLVNGEAAVAFVNTVMDEHMIKIAKKAPDGSFVEGAALSISGREVGSGEDIDEVSWTTGEDGETLHEASFKPGSYVLSETSAPEGYVKAEDIAFKVKGDGSVIVDGESVDEIVMIDEIKPADADEGKADEIVEEDSPGETKADVDGVAAEKVEEGKIAGTGDSHILFAMGALMAAIAAACTLALRRRS